MDTPSPNPLRDILSDAQWKLTPEQVDQCLERLTTGGIFSPNDLKCFSPAQIDRLGLRPKARVTIRLIIKKLNDSFHLHSVLLGLGCCHGTPVAQILQDTLEVDSWESFLELQEVDLQECGLPENDIKDLLEIIKYVSSFQKNRLVRDMENVRNRRIQSHEDFVDVQALSSKLKETVTRTKILVTYGVPLDLTIQDADRLLNQIVADEELRLQQTGDQPQEVDNNENELVSFNEVFGELVLNETLLTKLKSKFSDEAVSHVVTFVGATHVGKSTMIRQLVSTGNCVPAVAAINNYFPTTGNVHLYSSDMHFLNEANAPGLINLIDLEGSNSPSIPQYVLNSLTSQLKKLVTEQSLIERRRKQVNQNLPRFAYVMSDVVVYISEGSWANTEYRDNVVAFANAAVENVASAIRPCLIIVHNKCGPHEVMDVDKMTEKFISLHDSEENPLLKKLYESVACISMPDWYHDQDLFDKQVSQLKRLISDMLELQQKKRQRLGCLLSQQQWCDLLQYVIKNFTSKTLRIGTFMGELGTAENSLAKMAFSFFKILYDKKVQNRLPTDVISVRSFFIQARSLAIKKLAMMFLSTLRQETKTLSFSDDTITNEVESAGQFEEFKHEVFDIHMSKWYHILEILNNYIQKRAPCCAKYPGVRDQYGQEVYCTQEYGEHDAHRNPAMIYAPPVDGGFVETVVNGVKQLFGMKVPSVWDGDYDYGDEFPSFTADKMLLEAEIQYLQKLNQRTFFMKTIKLVQQACSGSVDFVSEETCFICQDNPCTSRLVPCGHTFCRYCVSKLLLVSEECPVCDTKIDRTVEWLSFSYSLGTKAVQNLFVEVCPFPTKIISIVGKLPQKMKEKIACLAQIPYLVANRPNPLHNFAFCVAFTGHKSCIYIEGKGPNKSIVVHYVPDRLTQKPFIYPYLTSDFVILFDPHFAYRLPRHKQPFVVEPVSSSKVRPPARLTLSMILDCLSPAPTKSLSESELLSELNRLPFLLPEQVNSARSHLTMQEWCLFINELRIVEPNLNFTFIYGSDSLLKKKLEIPVYFTPILKLLQFLQLVERAYQAFPEFCAISCLLNIINAVVLSNCEVLAVKNLVSEMLSTCRLTISEILYNANEYYGVSKPALILDATTTLQEVELERELNGLHVMQGSLSAPMSRVLTLRRLALWRSWLNYLRQNNESHLQEIFTMLAYPQNTGCCNLCMSSKGMIHQASPMVPLTCGHLVCESCWSDIIWLDGHYKSVEEHLSISSKPIVKPEKLSKKMITALLRSGSPLPATPPRTESPNRFGAHPQRPAKPLPTDSPRNSATDTPLGQSPGPGRATGQRPPARLNPKEQEPVSLSQAVAKTLRGSNPETIPPQAEPKNPTPQAGSLETKDQPQTHIFTPQDKEPEVTPTHTSENHDPSPAPPITLEPEQNSPKEDQPADPTAAEVKPSVDLSDSLDRSRMIKSKSFDDLVRHEQQEPEAPTLVSSRSQGDLLNLVPPPRPTKSVGLDRSSKDTLPSLQVTPDQKIIIPKGKEELVVDGAAPKRPLRDSALLEIPIKSIKPAGEQQPPTATVDSPKSAGKASEVANEDSNPPPQRPNTPYHDALIFKCPICQNLLFERLVSFIAFDSPTTELSHRAERLQCALKIFEEDFPFYEKIGLRSVENLELFSNSIYTAKLKDHPVTVKFFKPYLIGFKWTKFRRELAILRLCSHPSIIRLIGAYIPPETKDSDNTRPTEDLKTFNPFIVLERYTETLQDIINSTNRHLLYRDILLYSRQISSAIHFIHRLGLIYGCLRPSSLVIINNSIKLAEFGPLVSINEPDSDGVMLDSFYSAPEVLAPGGQKLTSKIDTFSMGKVLYEMLAKNLAPQLLANRAFYETEPTPFENGDPVLFKMISLCCGLNPTPRPDFDQLIQFFDSLKKDPDVNRK